MTAVVMFICSRDSQDPRGYRMDHLGTQETSKFRMYLMRAEGQLICRIPTWEWTVTWLSGSPNWVRQARYLVVRQSKLGVTST